jgi:hypothetical protein
MIGSQSLFPFVSFFFDLRWDLFQLYPIVLLFFTCQAWVQRNVTTLHREAIRYF